MNPQDQFCPNSACHASGEVGGGNIIVHSWKEKRYRCTCSGKTFSERSGTAMYGIKKPVEVFVQVTTLLAYGCPPQAIVAAFELDERTVGDWQQKAGNHCQEVHAHLVQEQPVDLQHVQGDEIRVKSQFGSLLMALAIIVSTRLWLGGVVSEKRDMLLIQTLVNQVRMMALCRPLLFAVDGLASYVKAAQRSFRSPLHTGEPGRPALIAWSDIALVQVVKQRHQGQRTIQRRIAQGSQALVQRLLATSHGGKQINKAYTWSWIERLNATFRQRLARLARRYRALTRTADMLTAGRYLVGTVYNFCTWHDSLRLPLYVGHRGQVHWVKRTPALAAGLTEHRWSVAELVSFKVPTSYQPLKRRGRPRRFVCSCGFA